MTGADACEAIRNHHRILGEELAARVSAVAAATAASQPYEAAVERLIAYLCGEVLPHAAAEEASLYPAAAALAGLAGTVAEMTAEHEVLAEATELVAKSSGAAEAAEHAEQIARLFATHVAKENDILLPALLASPDADLPALLADMHRLTEQSARGAGP